MTITFKVGNLMFQLNPDRTMCVAHPKDRRAHTFTWDVSDGNLIMWDGHKWKPVDPDVNKTFHRELARRIVE